MSQIIRPTLSPAGPAHGNTRNVDRSGLRYMSDSSIRTNPSIDEPSNMILPSSASSNWRSGISTFLIVPRMSVNWRRMNLTFSRSVRSRICAFVSLGAPDVVLAMGRILANFSAPTFVSTEKGAFMKLLKGLSVLVAVAGLGVLLLIAVTSISGHPLEALSQSQSKGDIAQREPVGSVGVQSDRSEPRRRGRELTILSGRGAEIGVSVRDVEAGDKARAGVLVEEVRPDSPAEKAGLKRSDVIVEFDGETVRSARQFTRLVQETAPGRTVTAAIVSDGARKNVQITPTEGRGVTIDGDRLRERLGDAW